MTFHWITNQYDICIVCTFIPKSISLLQKDRKEKCNVTVSAGMSQISQLGKRDAG